MEYMETRQTSNADTIYSFTNILTQTKRMVIYVLICCNMLSLANESIKCIWPLYAQTFDINPSEIGWILFVFYTFSAFGNIFINIIANKGCIQLTTLPSFILFISSIIVLFQATTFINYRVTSFIQISILFIILGFVSYNTLYHLTIKFSNIMLPYKYCTKFKQNILSSTNVLFAISGPTLSGLIMYLTHNDFYSIFYITSIIIFIITIYSLILCGKQKKLQLLQETVKHTDDEHTKLNGKNHKNGTINFNENEFPINNNNDNIQNENDGIFTNIGNLYSLSIIIESCFMYSAIQIIMNWYLYFMKQEYDTTYLISGLQLTIYGFCSFLGIFIVNKIRNIYKYNRKLSINKNNIYYHIMHIIFPLIFFIATYCMIFIDNDYLFGIIAIPMGLLMGLFYEENNLIFWNIKNMDNMITYNTTLFISNIGAAISNLLCGILLNDGDLLWIWIIISLCFLFQMLTAIIICIIYYIFKLKQNSNKRQDENASDLSSAATPPIINQHSSWSQTDKWKDDDIVGDLNISKLVKKYQIGSAHSVATSCSNSLGILDVDFVPGVFEKQNSDNSNVSRN